jgi:ubiquinone/menaquinone biosynthesis C-methylase UbiE
MSERVSERGHRFFAMWYDRLNGIAERRWLGSLRDRLVADLGGQVLEIGAGTGANLPYYRSAELLIAAEPDPAMRRRLTGRLDQAKVPVRIDTASAEDLPYGDAGFDAVVSTLVLCSVADLDQALTQIRRVLKPTGRFVFCEHVRDTGVRGRIQDLATPLWSRLAAGCHLDRDIAAAVARNGLRIDDLQVFRPSPNSPVTTPLIRGTAARDGRPSPH